MFRTSFCGRTVERKRSSLIHIRHSKDGLELLQESTGPKKWAQKRRKCRRGSLAESQQRFLSQRTLACRLQRLG